MRGSDSSEDLTTANQALYPTARYGEYLTSEQTARDSLEAVRWPELEEEEVCWANWISEAKVCSCEMGEKLWRKRTGFVAAAFADHCARWLSS